MTRPMLHARMSLQSQRRVAHSCWNGESWTFECTITPILPAEPSAPSLAEQLNVALHIRPPVFRLLLGDIDMLLDEDRQPKSIAVYTNPAGWKICDISNPQVGDVDEKIHLEVDIDEHDAVKVDVAVRIEHDPNRQMLLFRWGQAAAVWHRIADGLCFGLDPESRLTEILCERVEIERSASA